MFVSLKGRHQLAGSDATLTAMAAALETFAAGQPTVYALLFPHTALHTIIRQSKIT